MESIEKMSEVLLQQPPSWAVVAASYIDGSPIPEGFPLVRDEHTNDVCDVILFFLTERHLNKSTGYFKKATVETYSRIWIDWRRYLTRYFIEWQLATNSNLQGYIESMEKFVSPSTGRPYEYATRNQHEGLIASVYKWAADEVDFSTIQLPRNALLRKVERINLKGQVVSAQKAAETVSEKSSEKKVLLSNILQRHQARLLFEAFGSSLLSESMESDENPIVKKVSRDRGSRLAAEIAIMSGLRIAEITGLKISNFKTFTNMDLQPSRFYPISILGKGPKWRIVDFSGLLLRKIVDYITTDRKVAAKGKQPSASLILTSTGTTRGRGISNRTLQRHMSLACMRVGLVHARVKTEPVVADWRITREVENEYPLFSFHDLRHTFAVWTYYMRKKHGDSEPWKYVQGQLGHEDLQTTLKVYLRATNDFEAHISDLFYSGIRSAMAAP